MTTGQTPDPPPKSHRVRWVVAFALGFASCGVVTQRTSWGDVVWLGPLIGGVVTEVLATVRIPRLLARRVAVRGRSAIGVEAILRFGLMVILIAAAHFVLGALVIGLTFHD